MSVSVSVRVASWPTSPSVPGRKSGGQHRQIRDSLLAATLTLRVPGEGVGVGAHTRENGIKRKTKAVSREEGRRGESHPPGGTGNSRVCCCSCEEITDYKNKAGRDTD